MQINHIRFFVFIVVTLFIFLNCAQTTQDSDDTAKIIQGESSQYFEGSSNLTLNTSTSSYLYVPQMFVSSNAPPLSSPQGHAQQSSHLSSLELNSLSSAAYETNQLSSANIPLSSVIDEQSSSIESSNAESSNTESLSSTQVIFTDNIITTINYNSDTIPTTKEISRINAFKKITTAESYRYYTSPTLDSFAIDSIVLLSIREYEYLRDTLLISNRGYGWDSWVGAFQLVDSTFYNYTQEDVLAEQWNNGVYTRYITVTVDTVTIMSAYDILDTEIEKRTSIYLSDGRLWENLYSYNGADQLTLQREYPYPANSSIDPQTYWEYHYSFSTGNQMSFQQFFYEDDILKQHTVVQNGAVDYDRYFYYSEGRLSKIELFHKGVGFMGATHYHYSN